MEGLTIADLDEPTLKALRQKADRDGKSVEEEAADLIRKGLDEPPPAWNREAVIAELQRVAAMTPQNVKQTDSAVLLREDRDR